MLLAVDGYRLRRQGRRPARRGRGDRGRAADSASTPCTCATSVTGDDDWTGAARRARAARVRAGPVRPSALRAVQLGHDRAAEGDRARARRHHRRAPQDARVAPRPRRRRPLLLVHHDRLDDVELPRVRAARRVRRSCCSTATRAYPDLGDAVAARGRDRRRRVRRQRAVPHGLPQGRRACRPRTDLARRRLDRRAAAARRLPLGARRRSAPTCSRAR